MHIQFDKLKYESVRNKYEQELQEQLSQLNIHRNTTIVVL